VHFCFTNLLPLPCYYLCISFISCTCWVPTICVLNLAIFSYYSNLLLRRQRWTGILRRGVLDLRYPSCCSRGVIESSDVLFYKRIILVFRDIIYVINILYSWHLAIYEHFMSVCVEQLILDIHTMSTWFFLQNWVWQKWYQSRVNRWNASLDRRVLSLVLFLVFAKIFYSNLSSLLLIYKI
jgi:hypothetical protein